MTVYNLKGLINRHKGVTLNKMEVCYPEIPRMCHQEINYTFDRFIVKLKLSAFGKKAYYDSRELIKSHLE